MGRASLSKAERRRIGIERVERLLSLAEQAALEGRLDDAHRYSELAWRVKTRNLVPMLPALRTQVCRGCRAFLLASRTARVRVTGAKVSTTCLRCGRVHRRPLPGQTR